ncbi:hypothetical protein [uncultured Tateyamaria sp.]|uniref:hypothetical protein n=1 Tax=Tateyamaria sp. 1078 TaxID=3417464 RepID=UPI00261074DD|nr:hypothetical protein [uncultured Tateyamaria sp.]
MRRHCIFVFPLIFAGHAGLAEQAHTPYAGLEAREIATLSDSDMADLSAGRGWGLALAAELNGHPGPAHVLEHAVELELSADQVARVQRIFQDMQRAAIAGGEAFIAAERALNSAFAAGDLDTIALQDLVQGAGEARSALRFVHLSRHLETLDVLNAGQVARYNALRGYTDDPCNSVPEGHNAQMWRSHNGCDG